MSALDKKIFGVLHDPLHNEEHKQTDPTNEHVHLFSARYATNGSKELIQSDLDYALKEFILNLPEEGSGFQRMDDAPPYTYCMNDSEGYMDSFFMIWYATKKLRNDQTALEAFWKWIEEVVVGWANSQRLKIEVLGYKQGEYWRKFVITVPAELLNPKATPTI